MPIIPQYQPQATPEALPGVRLDPSAPSAAFGGVRPPDISGVASAVEKVALDAKQHADQVAITGFDNDLFKLKTTLLYGQNGLTSFRGADALPASDGVMKGWQQGVDALRQKATNRDQRAALENRITAHGADVNETTQRYVGEQIRAHDNQESQAAIENRVQQSALDWKDPDRIDQHVAEIRAIATDWAARNGVGAEDREALITKNVSAAYTGVIERMLDNKQDQAARGYYQQVQDGISGDDVGKVEALLNTGSLLGESQRHADGIMATATSLDAALRQARAITDPNVREATEKEVRQQFEDQAAGQRQAQFTAYLRASKLVEQGQDVPVSLRVQMDAQDNRLLFERAAQMRKNAAGLGDSDPDVYTQLRQSAFATPATRAEFAHLNLAEFKPYLSNADYKALAAEQTRALREGEHGQAAQDLRTRKQAEKDAQHAADLARFGLGNNPALQNAAHGGTAPSVPGAPLGASSGAPAAPAHPWDAFTPPAASTPSTPAAPRPGQPTVPETYLQHAQRDPKYRAYLTNMGIMVPDAPEPAPAPAPAPAAAPAPAVAPSSGRAPQQYTGDLAAPAAAKSGVLRQQATGDHPDPTPTGDPVLDAVLSEWKHTNPEIRAGAQERLDSLMASPLGDSLRTMLAPDKGTKPVKLTAADLPLLTLGQYDPNAKRIDINTLTAYHKLDEPGTTAPSSRKKNGLPWVAEHELAHRLAMQQANHRLRDAFDSIRTNGPTPRDSYARTSSVEQQAQATANAIDFLRATKHYRGDFDQEAQDVVSLALQSRERDIPGTGYMLRYLLDQPLLKHHPLRAFLREQTKPGTTSGAGDTD